MSGDLQAAGKTFVRQAGNSPRSKVNGISEALAPAVCLSWILPQCSPFSQAFEIGNLNQGV
jgi:hypothetical protein